MGGSRNVSDGLHIVGVGKAALLVWPHCFIGQVHWKYNSLLNIDLTIPSHQDFTQTPTHELHVSAEKIKACVKPPVDFKL